MDRRMNGTRYTISRQTLRDILLVLLVFTWVFSGWPQIFNFPPKISNIYAAQFGKPDADIDAGVWVTTPLWSKLDDGSTGDDVYASGDGSPVNTEPFSVQISNIGDPTVSTGHVLRAQWSKETTAGADYQGTLELRQGFVSEASPGTLIATLTGTVISGTTDVTDTYTLSAAEADAITDYSDLQLRAFAVKSGGGANRNFRIDFIELETPDAAPASTSFTQDDYRWYVDNDLTNPTEVWGTPDIAEDTSIAPLPVGNDPPDTTQELRLRVNMVVNGAALSVSSAYFKLQFKAGTDASCTTGSWTDVDSGQAWAYASSGVTDGADITEVLTTTTTGKGEEYAKSKPTQVNHVGASIGENIEYDFHIIGTSASSATKYSFRVVETDNTGTPNTVLDDYLNCPTLTTEPGTSNLLRHGLFFADQIKQGFFWAD